jgi:inosine/xanthosine triphosphate pyrophosphatase family protein
MRGLLGTTNPSKVKRFSDLLKGYDIEFITLRDIEVIEEPKEMGNTPEENAIMKAEFYGQYFDVVICNDSGLYFEELDFEDLRQPGLNIRTPMNRDRLSDEEIDYSGAL